MLTWFLHNFITCTASQVQSRSFILETQFKYNLYVADTLLKKFEKYPAQAKVLKLLFERGFQVNEEGKVSSGSIEIVHTQLAKEAGVDRRVVDATTKPSSPTSS
jgi:hypothetical protein